MMGAPSTAINGGVAAAREAMIRDRFGQRLSTASPAAGEAYAKAMDALLAAAPECLNLSVAALQCDPGLAVAHSLHARALLLEGRTAEGIEAARRGRELVAGASARERVHAEIVALATEGSASAALALLREHLREHPRDALPLSLALGVYGLLGFSGVIDHHQRQRDLLESLAPHYESDWWFDASFGWACVEAGEHEKGMELLERSLQSQPLNANAAHGLAHGYYERGEARAGDAFLANWLRGCSRRCVLHCHLHWHRALFALQLGEPARALRLYREAIRPAASLSVPMFTMIDGASLAWRSALLGHPLPAAELQALEAFLEEGWRTAGIPFANVHAAMVLAAVERRGPLADLIASMSAATAAGRQPCGVAGVRLCEAVAAFAQGDHADAGEMLAHWAGQSPRLGGSHAQRDVFVDTRIAALLRSGSEAEAAKVLQARGRRRAAHLDAAWLERLRG